jgi:hypothetical protein
MKVNPISVRISRIKGFIVDLRLASSRVRLVKDEVNYPAYKAGHLGEGKEGRQSRWALPFLIR